MPGVTTQPDGATGPADAAAPASSSSDRLSTDHHIGPVLFSAEQLAQRIALLGAQITEDYEGRAPLLVGVLRGASVFLTDLVRAIDLPVSMDFIAVSSYGSATQTSGVVRLVKDLSLIHISEPTRLLSISYAVFCLKKKKNDRHEL